MVRDYLCWFLLVQIQNYFQSVNCIFVVFFRENCDFGGRQARRFETVFFVSLMTLFSIRQRLYYFFFFRQWVVVFWLTLQNYFFSTQMVLQEEFCCECLNLKVIYFRVFYYQGEIIAEFFFLYRLMFFLIYEVVLLKLIIIVFV